MGAETTRLLEEHGGLQVVTCEDLGEHDEGTGGDHRCTSEESAAVK